MISIEYMEYVNKESIPAALICKLCENPFVELTVTPCNHSFCLECINQYLKTYSTCPSHLCDQSLQTADLKPYPTGLTHQILDELLVRCKLCKKTDIHRKYFDKHINEDCPKALIRCSMQSSGCSWIGIKEESHHHTQLCVFQTLKPTLNNLYENIQNLHICIEQIQRQLQPQEQAIDHVRRMENQIAQDKQQKEQIELIKIHVESQMINLKKIIEQIESKQDHHIVQETKLREELKNELEHRMKQHMVYLEQRIENQTNVLDKQIAEIKNDLRDYAKQQMSDVIKLMGNCKNETIEYTRLDHQNQMSFVPDISVNTTWEQNGVAVAGGNGQGNTTNQLYNPWGVFIDNDQTVIITDTLNHRIMQWKKDDTNGEVVAGGSGQGNRLNQLNNPTDVLIDQVTNSLIICDTGNRRVVQWSRRTNTTQGDILIDNIDCYGLAMDTQRYLYVSDVVKHEVRRYELGKKNGTLVAGGNGEGAGLHQFKVPRYIFVDRQQSLYVTDRLNHRVMKWNRGSQQGIIVAGGQDKGNTLTQLYYPNGLFVDNLGTVYVADSWNNRVVRWNPGTQQGVVIVGENGRGAGANQLNGPVGLSFDQHNNLYVVDKDNHRIQRFLIV